MSYFEDLDAWLTTVLIATEDDVDEEAWLARVKKQLKNKILESYRNGQTAGVPVKKSFTTEKPAPKAADVARPRWRHVHGR